MQITVDRQTSELITETISASCKMPGVEFISMVSRAYHDSLFMSRIAPTGMIFIPCYNGYSHRPDEYGSPENIACGVQVLAHSLAQLAQ
jgi:ureidoglycolate amidohydrolase